MALACSIATLVFSPCLCVVRREDIKINLCVASSDQPLVPHTPLSLPLPCRLTLENELLYWQRTLLLINSGDRSEPKPRGEQEAATPRAHQP